MLSFHTSPLVQPGSGDSGGMNVYVREVASALAQGGVSCTTYTRADRAGLPAVVHVEPGHRVVHVTAGPFGLAKEQLAEQVDVFADGVAAHIEADGGVDVVHGNYWLSGVAGHRLEHASACRWCRPSTRSLGSRPRAATSNRHGATGPRPR